MIFSFRDHVALVSELLGHRQDAIVTGLPPRVIDVLRPICPGLVHLQGVSGSV